ncbi:hypothetical protein [Azospirillum brasilense]|uniref:hypothetical protein n=1 Tax=Azospirillum brasilense TaxID=192 RepID=UPI0018D517A3|nr:hypothetical protein [Azospirillum brasilense]
MEIGKINAVIGPATVNYHRRIIAALRERSVKKAIEASNAHFHFSESVFNQEAQPSATPTS